jgi:[ribosomal protein S5]-alanine N-acetyltransferase
MKQVPILQTERLIVRPFAMSDLEDIHRLFDRPGEGDHEPLSLDARREWLQWMAALTGPFAGWYPPYGDRAVVLREGNILVGSVGFVAEIEPFESLPYLGSHANAPRTAEISLFWSMGQEYRRRGYATEAAQALVDFAFKELRLRRLFALADPDNGASLGVMRRLGMYIERAQGACGILWNPDFARHAGGTGSA